MRSKEYANDYRYFPEPDLPPLIVPPEMVDQVRASMPELPADRKARYVREGLTEYEAGVLVADRDVADYFEATLPRLKNRKSAANWVMTEVLRVARDSEKPFVEAVPPAGEVGALLQMVEAEKISLNAAKTAFAAMVKSGNRAEATIAELGLAQVSDENAIAAAVEQDTRGRACKGRGVSRRTRQAIRLLRRRSNEGDGRKSESESDQRNPARKTRRLAHYFRTYSLYLTPVRVVSPSAKAWTLFSHAYLPLVDAAKVGAVLIPVSPVAPILPRPV